MGARERREHIRVRPLPDLPVHAVLEGGGPLQVVDLSSGGLALLAMGDVMAARVGERVSLRVELAQYGSHRVSAEVRHGSDTGVIGVQFRDVPPPVAQALRRCVAELLERGAAA